MVAAACDTSRGALKARFRRRGLPSPSTYLRWFRVFAVAGQQERCLQSREPTVVEEPPQDGDRHVGVVASPEARRSVRASETSCSTDPR